MFGSVQPALRHVYRRPLWSAPGIPALTLAAVRHELLERDRERASRDVDEAAKVIRASASGLNVTSKALEGVSVILPESKERSDVQLGNLRFD
jgi:hypothetical protein